MCEGGVTAIGGWVEGFAVYLEHQDRCDPAEDQYRAGSSTRPAGLAHAVTFKRDVTTARSIRSTKATT